MPHMHHFSWFSLVVYEEVVLMERRGSYWQLGLTWDWLLSFTSMPRLDGNDLISAFSKHQKRHR